MTDLCRSVLTLKGSNEDIVEVRGILLYPDGNVHPELTFEFLIPMPQDIEDEGQWMLTNWGTYPPYEDKVLLDKEGEVQIYLETAYTYPEPVLQTILSKYPHIYLECISFHDASGHLCQVVTETGNLKEYELDVDELDISLQKLFGLCE